MNQNLDELLADRDRLRDVLKQIADHHDGQRAAWNDECADADNARYHEERRNFALFHLMPSELEEPREDIDLVWVEISRKFDAVGADVFGEVEDGVMVQNPTHKDPMRYLLFAGDDYYPRGGANDLKGCFDTLAAAIEAHDPNEFECDGGWANVLCLEPLKQVKRFYNGKWLDIGEDDAI